MSIWAHIKSKISSSCFPLNVMAWQIMRLRLSHYWTTLIELMQGCLVFVALFLARQSILPTEKSMDVLETLRTGTSISNRIFYSPQDNFTDTLMNDVITELNSNPVHGMRANIYWELSKNIILFDEYDQSDGLDNNIIIVNIMDSGITSNNFTYYIKMFNALEPKGEKGDKFNGIFRRYFPPVAGEIANPFLGPVQWAIDKTYIKQLINENITDLRLQDKMQFLTRDLIKLHKFIILCTIIAPLPYFMYKSSGIIVARRTGLKDLIRLSGVSSAAYRTAHFVDAAVMGFVYAVLITFMLKVTSEPVLPYSACVIIIITLIIYFFTVTALAVLASTICSNALHANSVAFMIYVGSFMLDFTWHSVGTTTLGLRKLLCCVFPHAPIYMFWTEVTYLEILGQGTNFSNFTKMSSTLSVLETWIFSSIQLFVMLLLDWYLDIVLPGKFGIPRKWYFMFEKDFVKRKKRKRVNFHVTAETKTHVLRDQRYFEKGPPNAEIAVKISKVTKESKGNAGRTRLLLDSVNFDIYRGEVTVVLGQTGSGKSVLMSIIAGLYAATKGTVYVNGLDNVQRVHDVLDIVAFCPQDSIIHKRLTVRENIMLFAKLTRKSTIKSVDDLIRHLNLTDQAHYYHTELSKGLLRCVQVACAIASDSDILVLDEPTSGMDYEARRRLWDLIMDLRGEKTIIMTTSYLEEAEVLGDRIAILSKGHLRCHGSPAFLKEAMGGGFNLTVTLEDGNLMGELFELVGKIIPNIKHKFHDKNTVTFVLPMIEDTHFPELFDALEASDKFLTITAIDVGLIMEDIFLEFVDEVDDNDIHMSFTQHGFHVDRLNGWKLILQQLKVLIQRNYHYMWMKKYQFIIVQVLIPIMGLIIVTATTNRCLGFAKFFQIQEIKTLRLLYNLGPYRRGDLSEVVKMHGLNPYFSEDVEKDFNPHSINDFSSRAIGLIMSQNMSTLIISPDPAEVCKSINLFSNAYLNLQVPHNNKRITTVFEAIPRLKNVIIKPKSWFLCLKWCVCVAYLSILNLAPSIILSISERKSGSRDTHIMAGCPPTIHWCSKLIAHFLVYVAVIPIPVLVSIVILEFDKTFDDVIFIASVMFLLILFGLAFLAHLYFMSFVLHESVAITQIFIMSLGLGTIIPIILRVMEYLWDQHPWLMFPYRIIMIVAYISPLYPFCVGLYHLTTQARLNAYCNLNKNKCPDLDIGMELFSSKICCESTTSTPFEYIDMAETTYLIVLMLHFIVYWILVIMMERRILHRMMEQIVNCNYMNPEQALWNPEVMKERDLVKNLVETKQVNQETFVAYDIHKNFRYFNTMKHRGKLNAVKGISLKAKAGECIGILGPPRAGKSTMLKMLSGAIVMTRGNCWIDGYSLKTQRAQYLKKTGRSGVDRFLTGFQNLLLISQLQGLSYNKATASSNLAIRYLGLTSQKDIKTKKYNVACSRRLELAVVYLLAPVVAFLDEPMSSADPMTKPLIRRALEILISGPTTVLMAITSVTKRDSKLLYDRIAILWKGQFMALGPAAELVAGLTTGYTVRIKLIVITSYKIFLEDEENPSLIDVRENPKTQSVIEFDGGLRSLKRDFREMFATSTLFEEHVCLLVYFIEDHSNTMLYSDMFSKLQELKIKYENLIDHYTLSAATIQDVLLRIRKQLGQM